MITVEYPRAARTQSIAQRTWVHLRTGGSIVMQVRGGKEVTSRLVRLSMKARMTFTSSAATPARPTGRNFVVFFVKDKGAPIVVPEK